MNKLLRISHLHPVLTIICVLLVTVLFGLRLPQLKIEITAEGMMVQDDPARVFYEESLKTFGSENITIVYFRDKDLFTRSKLLKIQDEVNRLNASPLVQRTDSLFSVRYIRTIDGFTYTSPYLKTIPKDADKLEDILQAARQNPLVNNNLLSTDGQSMAVNVFFDTNAQHRGFDQQADQLIRDSITKLQADFEEIFYIGDPYVRVGLTQRIKDDQKVFIPLAIMLLMVTLAVTLRQPKAALIPIITATVSIIWTLGLMAWLSIPLNIMTSVVPALLVIIGSTEDIHLISEFNSRYQLYADTKRALVSMADNMSIAVVLTFVTTYLGFLSITAGNLQLLQEFGLVASTGLLFNFVITSLLVPLLLRVIKSQSTGQAISKHINWYEKLASWGVTLSTRYRLITIVVIIAITIGGISQALKITVNNNVMDYFDEQSELRQNAERLHQTLSGIQTLSIILEDEEGAFLEVENLQAIWDLQDFLKSTGQLDSSYSLSDFISMVHSGLNDEWTSMAYLPQSAEVVEAYLSLIDAEATRSFLNHDMSQTRIMVRHNISSSEQLTSLVRLIEEYFESQHPESMRIHITGESYLNSKATEYLATGQFWSLLLILTAIFLIVSLLFMNFKAGLIAAMTGLFPIVILFGVMGYFQIPINTSTAMVAAISLGISVDYTMHFMVRYNRLSRIEGNSITDSLLESAREEAQPVISTAIALAIGFLSFSISDFPPVERFGQLSALVMLAAVISTFVLAVLMLHHVKLVTVWDILSIKLKQEVLQKSQLFAGMSRWQARKVMAMTKIEEFADKNLIMVEGQPIEHFYVLLEGQIKASRTRKDGSTYFLGFSDPGTVFGSLFHDAGIKCSSDLIAEEPSKMLRLDWQDIHQISRYFPRVSLKLYKNLSTIVAMMMQQVEGSQQASVEEPYGAYTHAVFLQIMRFIVDHARRYDEPLSMITITLLPISEGDKSDFVSLSAEVAGIVNQHMRKADLFGRWDEQTLMLALPNTPRDLAMRLETRLVNSLDDSALISRSMMDIVINVTSLRDSEDRDVFLSRAQQQALQYDWQTSKNTV